MIISIQAFSLGRIERFAGKGGLGMVKPPRRNRPPAQPCAKEEEENEEETEYPVAAGDPGEGSIGVYADPEWGSPESEEEGVRAFQVCCGCVGPRRLTKIAAYRRVMNFESACGFRLLIQLSKYPSYGVLLDNPATWFALQRVRDLARFAGIDDMLSPYRSCLRI